MRAALTASLCLVCLSALAAPPRGKAIGEAKEDEPLICPAPGASASADLALLRGLTSAFEPAPTEVRVQAIEDLGFLGDPRALNLLAQLCLDPNPAIARAAIRAIGLIRHPRAEEILSNVVRHPTVPDATKLRALELLPYQNSWSSLRFIRQTAMQTSSTTSVVMLARRMTAELPQRPFGEPVRAPAGSFQGAPFAPPPGAAPASLPAQSVPMVPGDSK